MVKVEPLTGSGRISAEAVRELTRLHADISDLKDRIKGLESISKPLEEALIAAVEEGKGSERGCPPCVVDITKRICPHWAEEFVSWCGKEAAQVVRDNTPPTIIKRLVIKA